MKKLSLVLTLFVLSAMLLAACDAGGPGDGTAVPTMPGGLETPGLETPVGGTPGLETPVDGTPGLETPVGGTPGLETPVDGTPGLETPVDGTPSLETPGAATGTPGIETPIAGTGTPGADLTGTPAAGEPGGETGRYVLLSELLTMPVNGLDASQIGLLQGLFVEHEMADAGGAGLGDDELEATGTPDAGTPGGTDDTAGTPEAGDDVDVTGTPDAGGDTGGDTGGEVEVTGTPAAGEGPGTGDDVGEGTGPTITYVLVDVTGGTDAGMNTPEAGDATGTPEADTGGTGDTGTGDTTSGSTVLVPWDAFDTAAVGTMDGLTLNVDESVLAAAPPFTEDMAETGPDAAVAEYWNDQGFGIPVTAPEGSTNRESVLIRGSITGLSITDASGQVLGDVSDFVVDLLTGDLVYAILSGGDTFGSNFYAVPVNNLQWQSGMGAGSLGSIVTNFDASAFDTAPSVTSIDQFDWNDTSEIDSFWQGYE